MKCLDVISGRTEVLRVRSVKYSLVYASGLIISTDDHLCCLCIPYNTVCESYNTEYDKCT